MLTRSMVIVGYAVFIANDWGGECGRFPMLRSQDGGRCEEPSSLRPYVERPIRKYAARGISLEGEPLTSSDKDKTGKKDGFAGNTVAHSSTRGKPSLGAQDNAAKLPRPCPGHSRAEAPIGKLCPGGRTRRTRANGRQNPDTSVFEFETPPRCIRRSTPVGTYFNPTIIMVLMA